MITYIIRLSIIHCDKSQKMPLPVWPTDCGKKASSKKAEEIMWARSKLCCAASPLAVSASLHGFKARIAFADHKNAAASAHHLTVRVACLGGLQ